MNFKHFNLYKFPNLKILSFVDISFETESNFLFPKQNFEAHPLIIHKSTAFAFFFVVLPQTSIIFPKWTNTNELHKILIVRYSGDTSSMILIEFNYFICLCVIAISRRQNGD